LSLAINRQEIVNKVLQGMGTVEGSAGIQSFPGMPGFDPTLKVDPYDPERAKSCSPRPVIPTRRRSASSSIRHRMPPVRPTRRWHRRSRLYWRNIGIDVKERTSDYANLMDQGIKRKLAGVVWVYPTPAFDEPIMQLYTVTYSKARTQLFGEYPELDALLEKTSPKWTRTSAGRCRRKPRSGCTTTYRHSRSLCRHAVGGVAEARMAQPAGQVTVGYLNNVDTMYLAK
jgi:hypothetical protein